MKPRLLNIIFVLLVLGFSANLSAAENKLRILVLADIENDPEHAMSIVRFLTYCNQWDVEGFVATTFSCWLSRPNWKGLRRGSVFTYRLLAGIGSHCEVKIAISSLFTATCRRGS